MGEIEYDLTAERRLAIVEMLYRSDIHFRTVEGRFREADQILHYVETGEHHLPEANEVTER